MTYDGFFYRTGEYGEGALARDASQQANTAASDARKARSESEGLTDRVERLALMTEALWLLLKERLGVSEDELVKIARDLDLSDGVLDGRVKRVATKCLGCGRMVGKQHPKCLYCGTEMPRTPFTGV